MVEYSLVVSLANFGVLNYQQSDAGDALKKGKDVTVIECGNVVRLSKDKQGMVSREVLTKRWMDWVDYWAIDYDYDGAVFKNSWQSFRTRQDRSLLLEAPPHACPKHAHTIAVMVIDIFANETLSMVQIPAKKEVRI